MHSILKMEIMKPKTLTKIVLMMLLVANQTYSQKLSDYDFVDYYENGIAPAKKDGKWGFVNEKGKTIVTPSYDFVFRFSEDLAPVIKNNKWGYVNQNGEEVIPLEYDYADHFSKGLARIYKDGFYMFIDSNNEVVISDEYVFAEKFVNGITITAKKVKPRNYEEILYGLIDSKGNVVADFDYNVLANVGNNTYAYDSYKYERDYNYGKSHLGYLNRSENTILEIPYEENEHLHPFFDMKKTYKKKELEKTKQTSLESEKILQKLNIPFDEVMPIYEQSAVFFHNNLAGVVNTHNNTVISSKFIKTANMFKDGLLEVYLDDEYYFIDKTGQKVSINLMHFIKMSDEYRDLNSVDKYFSYKERTQFTDLTASVPPPPPPAPDTDDSLPIPPPPPAPTPPPAPAVIVELEEDEEVEEVIIEITDNNRDEIDKEIDYIYFSAVKETPSYPGCEKLGTNDERKSCTINKIKEFIDDRFDTTIGKELGLSGINRVSIFFKINKKGKIEDVSIRSPHPKLTQEGERVVALLPKMQPGKHNGKVVNVSYALPFKFEVTQD